MRLIALVSLILFEASAFSVLRAEDLIDYTWRASNYRGFQSFLTFYANGSIAAGANSFLSTWQLDAFTHYLSIFDGNGSRTVQFSNNYYDRYWKWRLEGVNLRSSAIPIVAYLFLEQVI